MPLVEPCHGCPYGPIAVRSTERRGGCEIAFLGEGPADDEENAATMELDGPHLFVGAAGRELEIGTLARADLSRMEVAIENAHQCKRTDKGGAKEIRATNICRPRVAEFLRQTRPQSLMLLGGAALRSVLGPLVPAGGSARLLKHRGSIWRREEVEAAHRTAGLASPLPEETRLVSSSIHPAAIIRRKRLERFPAMAYRPVPGRDTRLLLASAREGLKRFPTVEMRRGIDVAALRDGFVFDLETTVERPPRPLWIGVQALKEGNPPVYGEVWSQAKEAVERLMSLPCPKVGHNIQGFDVLVLAEQGIEVASPYEDTMAQAGLVEPDLARGLDFRCGLYLGHRRPYWKELHGAVEMVDVARQSALRAAWRATGNVPEGIETEEDWMRFYCALDVDSDRRLFLEQREAARREGWV